MSFFNTAASRVTSVAITISAVTPNPSATFPYCDVTGYVTTADPGPNQVNFELGLPDTWNNKFLFLGNGGFAGSIQESVTIGFPYATAATDTGHQANELDGSWALGNQAAQDDFGYRGVHVTALAGEALTNAYYAASATENYFYGCSDGGREAMVEAEQFPTDFNGIIAGDPAIGTAIAGFNWNYQALFKTADSWIPAYKWQLVDAAVMNNCDAADGVVDGLIQDPRLCTFTPASLKCAASNPDPDEDPLCLSNDQVAALAAIYKGLVDKKGVQVYPGYTKSDPGEDIDSNPADVTGWGEWIGGLFTPTIPVAGGEPWGAPPGSFATAPLQWTFQDQFLKYFYASSASYNSFTFDVNTDLTALLTVSTVGGSQGDDAHLLPFKKAGGKLLLYHGWSDPALTPLETVRFYEKVVNKTFAGNLTKVRRFARLFMVPGMHHCGGGPGPNIFDPLTPLDTWVTTGTAPDSIPAVHYFENVLPPSPAAFIDREMPLCAYPETAHYVGGDVYELGSWKCK